jgi:hypothetical protein
MDGRMVLEPTAAASSVACGEARMFVRAVWRPARKGPMCRCVL